MNCSVEETIKAKQQAIETLQAEIKTLQTPAIDKDVLELIRDFDCYKSERINDLYDDLHGSIKVTNIRGSEVIGRSVWAAAETLGYRACWAEINDNGHVAVYFKQPA